MTDREVLHAIAARLQTLVMAARDLDQFVTSLANEAERSESRIRELAGAPMQPTAGNGSTQAKRRGRPPRDAQPTTLPVQGGGALPTDLQQQDQPQEELTETILLPRSPER
jgi:hypothetical protein